jgi:hypothetical protein
MKISHFITTIIIIILIFSAGCTTKKVESSNTTYVNSSSVVIVETPTPYAAPTIEKINHSHYVRTPITPTPTPAADIHKYQKPDPIVGVWDITNVTPVSSFITFSTSGTGGVNYLSIAQKFVWDRVGNDGGNITYAIHFYSSDQNDIFVFYDTTTDTGQSSVTEENQFLVRRYNP